MRLPGYRRQPPDPMRPGVMAPPAPQARSRLPRLRLHPLCLFGHKPDPWRLHAPGETWTTFVSTCLRCNRVVGDSYAKRCNK